MTALLLHILCFNCILLVAVTSAVEKCPSQVQMGSHQYEYSYGPCRVKVEEKIDQNSNGQSISFNVLLRPSSGCQHQTPEVPGYVHLPGYGYYKYHSTPMTWIQGWEVCKREGGHLAVFNSEEEAKFVGSIPNTHYDWAFIGFHDLYQEGNYVTVFDQTLVESGWSKWDKSNPNGKTEENCGVTFPNGEIGDFTCSTPRTFFCEISCQNI